jgi:hypothetical protein
MKGTPLTRTDVLDAFERLLHVYRRPAQAPDDLTRFADDYMAVCHDVSIEQFRQAVQRYLESTARWFPKPGELRALALQQPRASPLAGGSAEEQLQAWVRSDWSAPCPVCGVRIETPRTPHDHARHVALGASCHGRCDAPPGTCCSPFRRDAPRPRPAPAPDAPPVPAAPAGLPSARPLPLPGLDPADDFDRSL